MTIGFVPARAGSQGLPGKNIRLLGGKPLYYHSVDQAIEAGLDPIYISTDIAEILGAVHPSQVALARRPHELATSTADMASVISDFLSTTFQASETVVLLQPTSPLRTARHIQKAVSLFETGRFTLVMSVCRTESVFLKYGSLDDGRFVPVAKPEYCFANRQSLPEMYRPNGAIYVFDADRFRREGKFPMHDIGALEMTLDESVDIDANADLARCEQLLTAMDASK